MWSYVTTVIKSNQTYVVSLRDFTVQTATDVQRVADPDSHGQLGVGTRNLLVIAINSSVCYDLESLTGMYLDVLVVPDVFKSDLWALGIKQDRALFLRSLL